MLKKCRVGDLRIPLKTVNIAQPFVNFDIRLH